MCQHINVFDSLLIGQFVIKNINSISRDGVRRRLFMRRRGSHLFYHNYDLKKKKTLWKKQQHEFMVNDVNGAFYYISSYISFCIL